ncbi:MAG: 4-hydroxythreonine-4-phosphate dehydrogenase PdxA [Bacteroidetes bacterium]|nr:4-hydroxythreonine-4-phosphate dehydrogenase PdxA [Bacteroidota bacterium]
MNDKKLIIGITAGDCNGIGYEVILKTFADPRLAEMFTPVIYGSRKYFTHYRKELNLDSVNFQLVDNIATAQPKKLNLVNCVTDTEEIQPGVVTKEAGTGSLQALERATKDLLENKIHALITAPINKDNIQSDEFRFPGHTEYLEQASGAKDSLMFLVSPELKIGVVTGHVPVAEVAGKISVEKILSKLTLMNNSLKNDFLIRKPKIAVLGLNPHAGDNGLLGKEEIEIISPAIAKAKAEGIFAHGPYSADGFFGNGMYKNFDGVLGMYHDQGLIPFKTLSFGSGVNFTAGLSIVRTSPDHGTAYEIAGQNKADESSFRNAIYSAMDILANRKLQHEISGNPLVITDKDKMGRGSYSEEERHLRGMEN